MAEKITRKSFFTFRNKNQMVAPKLLLATIVTFFSLRLFSEKALFSISLAVIADDNLAVKSDIMNTPQIIQNEANTRAGTDLGVLSPYLKIQTIRCELNFFACKN